MTIQYNMANTPPMFLTFAVGEVSVKVTQTLDVDGHEYSLCGLIYFGSFHFVSRIVDLNGMIWYNDGIQTGSVCLEEGNIENMSSKYLRRIKEKDLSTVVYVKL